MRTRIKKNVIVIFGGHIWPSGTVVPLSDLLKMKLCGFEIEKITELKP